MTDLRLVGESRHFAEAIERTIRDAVDEAVEEVRAELDQDIARLQQEVEALQSDVDDMKES